MRQFVFPLLLAASAFPAQVYAEAYLARCQMGECAYYDQTERAVLGQSNGAIAGELVQVTLRGATSASERASSAQLAWGEPAQLRFFCSYQRPAFEQGEGSGSYMSLDLGQIYGATTLVTTMYVKACHPDIEFAPGDEAALRTLGYRATGPMTEYASFAALTAE